MTDQEKVLAANEGFYVAFARGDYPAMQALWAQDAAIACVHPGWPPLQDRIKIMQSWQGILANPPKPPIVVVQPQVQLYGDVAIVICWEQIGSMNLVATNIFVREHGAWRMVMHQSGQTSHAPKGTASPSSSQPTTTVH